MSEGGYMAITKYNETPVKVKEEKQGEIKVKQEAYDRQEDSDPRDIADYLGMEAVLRPSSGRGVLLPILKQEENLHIPALERAFLGGSVKVKKEHKDKPKLPFSIATASLEAKFNFNLNNDDEIVQIYAPARNIHAQLYSAEQGYRVEYGKLYNGKSGKERLDSANIVTAELGLIYADTTREEGYISELKFAHTSVIARGLKSYSLQVPDFFDSSYAVTTTSPNKALRSENFNAHLEQRIKLFEAYDIFAKSTTALTPSKDMWLAVNKGNFHETYHHSEQAVMELFTSGAGQKFIAEEVQKVGAKTVVGIILDMYSTRYVCQNCNVSLLGFQASQEEGAIADLTKTLESNKYRINVPKDGLLWTTRVSADLGKSPSENRRFAAVKDKETVHQIAQTDRHKILQSNVAILNLSPVVKEKDYSLDSFGGDFFTSRALSQKKMEKRLKGT